MRKHLLRGLFLILTTTAIHTQSHAQKSMINYLEPEGFSVGMTFGMTDLWGDIGTQSILFHYANGHYWSNTKFIGGVYGGYTLHPSLGIRLSVNHGTLYASDKFNKELAQAAPNAEDDAYQRYMRNQEVKSILWESNFMFEFTPLRMNIESNSAMKRMQPYLLAGIGGYHFNPKARHYSRSGYETGWRNLYDLNLEGNGWNFPNAPERYSRWQMNIPLGLGLKWDIDQRLGFGVEYIYRYCFTDYLDNVSGNYIPQEYYFAKMTEKDAQLASDMSDRTWMVNGDKTYYHKGGEVKGNPEVNDAYSSLQFRLYWKILRKKLPWWY